MNDKYYSDLITERLYGKIIAIRKDKGLIDDLCRKTGDFTFIFVNPDRGICSCIEEKELETKKVEHDIFTRIIVFTNTQTYRSGYWNHHIIFIGIFDMFGNESTICFDSIQLNSITTGCIGYGYNDEEITSCNITLLDNPFHTYLRQVLRPVKKAITSSLNNQWRCDNFELEDELVINIVVRDSYRITNDFNDFLKYLKDFDKKYYDRLGRLYKFNPQQYT